MHQRRILAGVALVAVALGAERLRADYIPWSASTPQTATRFFDRYYNVPIPTPGINGDLRSDDYHILAGVDADGNGQANDSIRYLTFSLKTPLNTFNEYYLPDKSGGRFYGGLVSFNLNTLSPTWGQMYMPIDDGAVPYHVAPDGRFLRGGDYTHAELNYSDMALRPIDVGPAAFDSIFLWKRNDFKNGYNQRQIVLDSRAHLSVAITRGWYGMAPGRFVVMDGQNFYISETTFEGYDPSGYGLYTDLDASATRWALYKPKAPFAINFDEQTADFEPHEFNNVKAVGVQLHSNGFQDSGGFSFDDLRLELGPVDGYAAAPKDVPNIRVANKVGTKEKNLQSGQKPPVKFTSVRQGATGPVQIFNIHNDGFDSMSLTSMTVPAGFKLLGQLSPELLPGDTDTFKLRMITKQAGKQSGLVTIASDDPDTKKFKFNVLGQVLASGRQKGAPLAPAQEPGHVILPSEVAMLARPSGAAVDFGGARAAASVAAMGLLDSGETSAVPEPASMLLVAAGLGMALGRRRR